MQSDHHGRSEKLGRTDDEMSFSWEGDKYVRASDPYQQAWQPFVH